MSKTPDEIKKGLEICNSSMDCNDCPYLSNRFCIPSCKCSRNADALAYIQRLEAELEDMTARYKIADDCAKKKGEMNEKLYAELSTVKAERDAAVRDMTEIVLQSGEVYCDYCGADFKPNCKGRCWTHNEGFKWRGVHKEDTP